MKQVVSTFIASGKVPVGETLLGRYLIEECLGRGATSLIIRARDKELHRDVALKIWCPISRSDVSPDAGDFLRLEAQKLAAIAHRNICRVFDFGVDDEIPWISMEFIRGQTLREMIRARADGMIPGTRGLLSLIRDMARAIEYLHGAGIIQLDIKPDNMIISAGSLVVIDLASAIDKKFVDGRLFLTPGYAAPELLGAACNYSTPEELTPGATDVFALGMTIRELLTGRNLLHEHPAIDLCAEVLELDEKDIQQGYYTWDFRTSEKVQKANRETVRYLLEEYCACIKLMRAEPTPNLVSGPLWALTARMIDVDPSNRPSAVHIGDSLNQIEILSDATVFVSHANADKKRFVDRFANALRAKGLDVWYDSWSLRPGEPIWDRVVSAVDKSVFMILVLSRQSLNSPWVAEETRVAQLSNLTHVKIVPILLDRIPISCLPPGIRSRHVVRFPSPRGRAFGPAVDKLVSDLSAMHLDGRPGVSIC